MKRPYFECHVACRSSGREHGNNTVINDRVSCATGVGTVDRQLVDRSSHLRPKYNLAEVVNYRDPLYRTAFFFFRILIVLSRAFAFSYFIRVSGIGRVIWE